jgi:hypothetical protein
MNLKNFLSFILIALFCFTFSCSTQNDETTDSELNLSGMELSLKIAEILEIGQKIPIENKDLEHFISKNFNEIKKMEKDFILLFSNTNNSLYYSIETKYTLEQLVKNKPSNATFAKISCTNHRNKASVTSTLAEAIGDGSQEVFISVVPNYTLGIRTSISICHGTLPEIINVY